MITPKKNEKRPAFLNRAQEDGVELLEACHAWRLANADHLEVTLPDGMPTALLENEDDSIKLVLAGEMNDIRAASQLVALLGNNPDDDVEMIVNSGGGSHDQGVMIHNALKDHPGNTTAIVSGMAGSAALTAALGTDTIKIHANSLIMMHAARGIGMISFVGGQPRGMDAAASAQEMANKGTEELIDMLATRSGQTKAKVKGLVNAKGGNGTTLKADEAVDLGFADEVIANKEKSPTTSRVQFQAWAETELANCQSVELELQS